MVITIRTKRRTPRPRQQRPKHRQHTLLHILWHNQRPPMHHLHHKPTNKHQNPKMGQHPNHHHRSKQPQQHTTTNKSNPNNPKQIRNTNTTTRRQTRTNRQTTNHGPHQQQPQLAWTI